MTEMNEGARRVNEQLRHHGERLDRETTIELLRDIRDSLERIEENGVRLYYLNEADHDLIRGLPPSDEGELLEMYDSLEQEPLPDPPDPSQAIKGES